MRIPRIDYVNLYRLAGGMGLLLMGVSYLARHNAVVDGDQTIEMGVVLAYVSALWCVAMGASFRTHWVREQMGLLVFVVAVGLAVYYSLWLVASSLAPNVIIDSLLFSGLVAIMFHTRTLVLCWLFANTLILGLGASYATTNLGDAAGYVMNLTALVAITGLMKVQILTTNSERLVEQAMLTSLFDQSTQSLLQLDGNGHTAFAANPHAKKTFGTSNAADIYECITHTLSLEGYTRDTIVQIISTNGVWQAEVEFETNQGQSFHGRVNIERLVQGNVSTLILRITDISALVAEKEALDRARRAAEQATQARTRFLANMSHEIRTPMNGVIGMTSLLVESDLSQEQRGYVDIIRNSGESLLSIINQILDFSKLDAGALQLEHNDFDLEQCLADSVDTVLPLASERGITVVLDYAPNAVRRVHGDMQRLRQILVNLLSNAVKFTEQGEVVLLAKAALDLAEPDQIRLDVEVQDTGIGIEQNKLKGLFNAFTQADASTTRRYGGTGLGLSISRSLVQQMGGDISVSSAIGVGSTFQFSVPLKSAGQTAFAPLLWSDRRTLVIDAHPATRDALVRKLAALDINVTAVANLGAAQTELPHADLVIADVPATEDSVATWVQLTGLTTPPSPAEQTGLTLRKPVRPQQLHTLLHSAASDQPTEHTGGSKRSDDLWFSAELRVLLAEDNLVNQRVALRMLAKLGINADVVGDGRQAVERATTTAYDLIFMDVQMPELDGLEAARQIRRHALARQPHIIALTANAFTEDQQACLEAGMNGFVAKPIRFEQLRATLHRASIALGAETESNA